VSTETVQARNQTSILDRLIDLEPGVSRETVQNRLSDYRQLMASVRRDLENLLNTKNFVSSLAAEYSELQNSLFVYGLPDFTAENSRSASVMDHLREEVEKAIRKFEPRLTNVIVTDEPSAQGESSMGFRVRGLLMVDPMPEPVTFDTQCDINRGEFMIK
jgi:type VI secretion system protein ImpF